MSWAEELKEEINQYLKCANDLKNHDNGLKKTTELLDRARTLSEENVKKKIAQYREELESIVSKRQKYLAERKALREKGKNLEQQIEELNAQIKKQESLKRNRQYEYTEYQEELKRKTGINAVRRKRKIGTRRDRSSSRTGQILSGTSGRA